MSILLQSFSLLSLKFAAHLEGLVVIVLIGTALCFLAARAALWQKVLQDSEITVVYPFAALVQIVILFYAVVLFGESLTLNNFFGVCLMLFGIYLISK